MDRASNFSSIKLVIIGHQNEITIEIMGLGDKCWTLLHRKPFFLVAQLRDNQFCVYRLSAAYDVYAKAQEITTRKTTQRPI